MRGEKQINLIFDMVIPIEYGEERKNDLIRQMEEQLEAEDSRYKCVITVDYDYKAKTEE